MGIISTAISMTTVIDGENSIRLDIDNEMDMVQTDSTGKVVTARTVETICHLYDGSSEVQLATTDITAAGATPSLSGKGVKLSWTFAVGSTFTDQVKTITCTKYETPYHRDLTIIASKGQPIYQLRPSAAAISFQRNADNTLTPASKTVGLSILKIDGNSTAELTTVPSGLNVRYSTSSMPAYNAGTSWSSGDITVANTASNLYIAMYNSSNVLLDKETIPVVFDGNNGTSPYVADLTNQMDSVFVDSESLTVVRQSASTQVMMFYGSQQVNFTIESVQRKYDNGDGTTTTINQPSGTKVYGVTVGFAAAAAGQRGVSVQYDADKQVHGTETFAITVKPAQGTTDTFEVDFTINAVRGTYYNLIPAEKAIRATRNDSGELEVDGSTTYSMTCTYIMKNPLTGVTNINPVTTSQLYEDAPYYVYYRIRKIQNQAWQAYQAFNNSATVTLSTDDAIELLLCTNTSAPTSDSLITGLMDQETVYVMADGKKGEQGEDAAIAFVTPDKITVQCNNDGSVKQQVSATVTFSLKVGTHTDTTITSTSNSTRPTGVTIDVVDTNKRTITISTSATATGIASGINFTVNGTYDGKSYSAPCTLAMLGVIEGKSIQGDTGHTGRWYYYDGVYDSTNTYTMQNTQAPFVMRHTTIDEVEADYFFMLDFGTSGVETDSTQLDPAFHYNPMSGSGTEPWTLMQSTMRYYIANAFFGEYAHLGSFIINGDWMISQNATSDSPSSDYTDFDPSYPNTSTGSNFIPVYCVNGLTGAVYMNDAHMKNAYMENSYLQGEVRITNSNNLAVVKINGNQESATSSETYVTILDSAGLYSRGSADGIRLTHGGSGTQLQRYHSRKTTWTPLFAQRVVDVVSSSDATSGSFTLDETYDFVIANPVNNFEIYLPKISDAGDGKIITIQCISYDRTVTVKSQRGNYIVAGNDNLTQADVSNYERAEFVSYGQRWYAIRSAWDYGSI